MGAWGAGNFQDDTALDWLRLSVRQPIVEEIQSWLKKHDEGNGPAIIAAVEVLALLCERLPAEPPRPEEVTAWQRSYLRGWNRYIDGLEPTPEYKAKKLEVIKTTFEKLLALSKKWHAGNA